MSDRQEKILMAIVEEYITNASPVGSATLSTSYDLGIGPAMIRHEMATLEQEGWLSQPHTSAGRIPTDKAYRFYISRHIKKEKQDLSRKEQKQVRLVVDREKQQGDLLKEVSRVASDISRELSVSGLVGEKVFFTHGFANLASEPELQESSHIMQLMRFADEIDRCFASLWRHIEGKTPRVFIGSENPVREIREFTLITGRYGLGEEQTGFISLIGPRRMDYRKNLALINHITSTLNKLN